MNLQVKRFIETSKPNCTFIPHVYCFAVFRTQRRSRRTIRIAEFDERFINDRVIHRLGSARYTVQRIWSDRSNQLALIKRTRARVRLQWLPACGRIPVPNNITRTSSVARIYITRQRRTRRIYEWPLRRNINWCRINRIVRAVGAAVLAITVISRLLRFPTIREGNDGGIRDKGHSATFYGFAKTAHVTRARSEHT